MVVWVVEPVETRVVSSTVWPVRVSRVSSNTFLNDICWKRVGWGVVIFLKKHYRFAKPIMFANNTP
jgi:hypothetical protein